jgi:methylenetetrahydrofolate reductase (NADPH)
LSRPKSGRTAGTNFFAGAVATNFKRYENEVVPQLLKLEKKIECGGKFIIAQIGYDARKSHEMLCYLAARGMRDVPLIGNVYLLNLPVARFFRKKTIPGVVISDALFDECSRRGAAPDQGARFFKELAAKQIAIFKGLGFAGAYLGGVHTIDQVNEILDIESTFAPDDWKQFAREIQYPVEHEFYYFARDERTGLADPARLNPQLQRRGATHNVTLAYRLSKLVHDAVFTPGKPLYNLGRRIYASARDPMQGPRSLRVIEHASKAAMFRCKDCGDCSLPDIAFLCPESQCAKNQRNGPCGGTRDGKCEVHDYQCIWSRAYDRLKHDGCASEMLVHAPVIQDESLRGTSSWANAFLDRDHTARKTNVQREKPDDVHNASTQDQPNAPLPPAQPAAVQAHR